MRDGKEKKSDMWSGKTTFARFYAKVLSNVPRGLFQTLFSVGMKPVCARREFVKGTPTRTWFNIQYRRKLRRD